MPDTAAGAGSFIIRRRQAAARCKVALDQIGLEGLEDWLALKSMTDLERLATQLENILAAVLYYEEDH
jgi:hypothetical protein